MFGRGDTGDAPASDGFGFVMHLLPRKGRPGQHNRGRERGSKAAMAALIADAFSSDDEECRYCVQQVGPVFASKIFPVFRDVITGRAVTERVIIRY